MNREPDVSPRAPAPAPRAGWTRNPYLLLVVVAFLGTASFALVRELSRGGARPPEVLAELPAMRFVDQAGAPFTDATMRGRAWIVSFFFTSCQTICPKLMKQVAEVQARTEGHGDALHLLSITVDPKTDTPERLRANAAKYGADLRRWRFLTGPIEDVERAVRQGFMQAMEREPTRGRNAAGEEVYDIAHSGRLVLVDAQARIRGFYETDEAGTAALLRDAALVVKESR